MPAFSPSPENQRQDPTGAASATCRPLEFGERIVPAFSDDLRLARIVCGVEFIRGSRFQHPPEEIPVSEWCVKGAPKTGDLVFLRPSSGSSTRTDVTVVTGTGEDGTITCQWITSVRGPWKELQTITPIPIRYVAHLDVERGADRVAGVLRHTKLIGVMIPGVVAPTIPLEVNHRQRRHYLTQDSGFLIGSGNAPLLSIDKKGVVRLGEANHASTLMDRNGTPVSGYAILSQGEQLCFQKSVTVRLPPHHGEFTPNGEIERKLQALKEGEILALKATEIDPSVAADPRAEFLNFTIRYQLEGRSKHETRTYEVFQSKVTPETLETRMHIIPDLSELGMSESPADFERLHDRSFLAPHGAIFLPEQRLLILPEQPPVASNELEENMLKHADANLTLADMGGNSMGMSIMDARNVGQQSTEPRFQQSDGRMIRVHLAALAESWKEWCSQSPNLSAEQLENIVIANLKLITGSRLAYDQDVRRFAIHQDLSRLSHKDVLATLERVAASSWFTHDRHPKSEIVGTIAPSIGFVSKEMWQQVKLKAQELLGQARLDGALSLALNAESVLSAIYENADKGSHLSLDLLTAAHSAAAQHKSRWSFTASARFTNAFSDFISKVDALVRFDRACAQVILEEVHHGIVAVRRQLGLPPYLSPYREMFAYHATPATSRQRGVFSFDQNHGEVDFLLTAIRYHMKATPELASRYAERVDWLAAFETRFGTNEQSLINSTVRGLPVGKMITVGGGKHAPNQTLIEIETGRVVIGKADTQPLSGVSAALALSGIEVPKRAVFVAGLGSVHFSLTRVSDSHVRIVPRDWSTPVFTMSGSRAYRLVGEDGTVVPIESPIAIGTTGFRIRAGDA